MADLSSLPLPINLLQLRPDKHKAYHTCNVSGQQGVQVFNFEEIEIFQVI